MVLINENWVSINNSTDVLNLIKECIGDDAARASEYFVRDEKYEDEIEDLKDRVTDLEYDVDSLEDENSMLSDFKESFENLISDLKELDLSDTELSEKLGNIITKYMEV